MSKRQPLSLRDVVERYGPALAPVIISRLPVFAPVERRGRIERTVTVTTAWGEVSVTGRLTQLHRSLLDAAIATALPDASHPTEDGGVTLVCDPYRLCRMMGTSTWDYEWLESLLRDLRRAEVRIMENGYSFPLVVTGILTTFGRYDRQKRLYPGRLSHRKDDRRDMILLTISAPWWSMWSGQALSHYKQVLPQIGRLSGLGQAVARLALTQQTGWRIAVNHALQAVGAIDDGKDAAARMRRMRARRELLQDRDGLADLGIDITGDTIVYHPSARTYISVPEAQHSMHGT